jgi:Histidine phosphatase superfamily (branch 1)
MEAGHSTDPVNSKYRYWTNYNVAFQLEDRESIELGIALTRSYTQLDLSSFVVEMADQAIRTEKPQRKLTVLLLRHGEREDEVPLSYPEEASKRELQSLRERIDPKLTVTGYRQATAAWKQILAALNSAHAPYESNFIRVGVVCSPMRRCVGTALMLSAAASANAKLPFSSPVVPASRIHWGWPISSPPLAPCITIVIWNGLCYCAAAIARLGGDRAIRKGLVACAADTRISSTASDTLDHTITCGSGSNRFMDELNGMLPHTRCAVRLDTPHRECASYGNGHLDCAIWQPLTFVGRSVNGRNGSSREYVECVLSRPVTVMSILDKGTGYVDAPWHPEKEDTTKDASIDNGGDTTFLDAIDQATRWAIDDGMEYLVVVSHREGIRSLADRCLRSNGGAKSDKDKRRFSTPYCCVGIFTAADSCESSTGVQWTFRSVSHYKDFKVKHLPLYRNL